MTMTAFIDESYFTTTKSYCYISDQMLIPVIIKDRVLPFLIDTGSAINVLHTDEMITLKPAIFIQTPKHNFASTMDGSSSQVFGEAKLEIDINNQSYTDDFSIMTCGQFSGILGRPFLNKYNAVINIRKAILLLEKPSTRFQPTFRIPEHPRCLMEFAVNFEKKLKKLEKNIGTSIEPQNKDWNVCQPKLPKFPKLISVFGYTSVFLSITCILYAYFLSIRPE